jgi:lysophospholipase L1-like esterase
VSGRGTAAALFVLSLGLVVGACSWSDLSRAGVKPPLAVVLGDSNTALASAELQRTFAAAGYTPVVRGIPGSGLKDLARDWLPAAAVTAGAAPAVVVVALGTNDAWLPENANEFAARFDVLLTALRGLPVVVVTHTEGGADGRHAPADEVRINEAIRVAPVGHPGVVVLDLAPDLAERPELLRRDRLHYSRVGRRWFARRIAVVADRAATAQASP